MCFMGYQPLKIVWCRFLIIHIHIRYIWFSNEFANIILKLNYNHITLMCTPADRVDWYACLGVFGRDSQSRPLDVCAEKANNTFRVAKTDNSLGFRRSSPQAFTWFDRVRFIAWRMRRSFFRNCPREEGIFCARYAFELQLLSASHCKKALYLTLFFWGDKQVPTFL